MSDTAPFTSTAPSAPQVLTGTPVVPGVAWGPVVRPAGAVRLPTDESPPVPDAERAAERLRFGAAAQAVADRLAARASSATGVSAEVLTATAGLARDRGLLAAVEQRIDAGSTAAAATVEAAEQFAAMFAALGGLMAERA